MRNASREETTPDNPRPAPSQTSPALSSPQHLLGFSTVKGGSTETVICHMASQTPRLITFPFSIPS